MVNLSKEIKNLISEFNEKEIKLFKASAFL